MVVINYPTPGFQIKQQNGEDFIFDVFRKKWLLLTPEEWVRQNFLNYLLAEMKYPSAFIAVEKEITLGEVKKRFDILVYNSAHMPWMMVECKAMEVKLSESVLQQVLRYNLALPVSFIVITNGSHTMAWQKESTGLLEVMHLPEWK